MSFPKYFVTYCVMDTEAGANPFGHSCLLFSEQKGEDTAVKVTGSYGYYSQPSTTKNRLMKFLKESILDLPVDLQNTHGVLKQEKMRELSGPGLKGMSFELTHGKYIAFKEKCEAIIEAEQAAIREYGDESTGPSRLVSENERSPADRRLKPFHISGVLNSEGSYTCKQRALDLLLAEEIINQETHKEITGGKSEYAFPRFSKGVRPIYMISTGRVSHKRVGERDFYNHAWPTNRDTEDNALHFATPMKQHDAPYTDEDETYYFLIKNIMARIYKVESLLRAAQRAPTNTESDNRKYTLHLDSVTNLRETFIYTSEATLDMLKEKIELAGVTLNNATIATYSEEYINSFMIRAYASMSAKNALVGLLAVMLCAAVLIAPPVGIAVTTAAAACASLATLYTANNAHRFFNEEREFGACKATQAAMDDSRPSVLAVV